MGKIALTWNRKLVYKILLMRSAALSLGTLRSTAGLVQTQEVAHWPMARSGVEGCTRLLAYEASRASMDALRHFDWPVVAEGKSIWARKETDEASNQVVRNKTMVT